MGEREPQMSHQSADSTPDSQDLPTVGDDRFVPPPADTLSVQERHRIGQAAEAVLRDITQPTPLPSAQDLFVAEPLHRAVAVPAAPPSRKP
jgi:hypothetical protein